MPAPESAEAAPLRVRRATAADAPAIARHRPRMFEDMGQLPSDVYLEGGPAHIVPSQETSMLRQSEPESLPVPGYDPVTERLLRARTIIISGEITQRLAATVSSQLLALAADSDADITVFLNSQGGHVEAGDTIHDLVRFIRPRVRMIGTGWVASAGALIYVAAPREQRFCLPNTRFLLHQPAGGAGGSASDIDIEAREILRMRDRLNRIFARETGQPLERIEEDTHRNFWLGAEAALRYGLVGRIIERSTDLDGA
jgi:ATP-dependent Clp protease protease subunit